MERDKVTDYFLEYEYVNIKPWMVQREFEVPLDSGFVISIIGPRRSGKTYYLLQISQRLRNHVYLNLLAAS